MAECPEVVICYGEVTSAAVAGVIDLKNRQNPMVKMEDDDENARRSELRGYPICQRSGGRTVGEGIISGKDDDQVFARTKDLRRDEVIKVLYPKLPRRDEDYSEGKMICVPVFRNLP